MVGTYNSKYPGDIGKSYGGYADYWRGPSHFVIKIPDELSSEDKDWAKKHAGSLDLIVSTVSSPKCPSWSI